MNKISVIIDRFEGAVAICESESGDFVRISRAHLPSSARESDILILLPNGWVVDCVATQQQKSHVKELEDELFI